MIKRDVGMRCAFAPISTGAVSYPSRGKSRRDFIRESATAPGRIEPCAVTRRPEPHDQLTKLREQARAEMIGAGPP